MVEPCEDRLLFAVFVVTTTADSGPGSLRQGDHRRQRDADHQLRPRPDRVQHPRHRRPHDLADVAAAGHTDYVTLDATGTTS
jgi:hypothetical protein